MASSNASRGSRSGGKGSSGGKSIKKKKQSFHRHRQQPQDSATPTPEELKSRVMIALDKLGHQKLSIDPGGYDLQSWTKNVILLLDEFQEKIQPATLPSDYFAKRKELTEGKFAPGALASVDREVEELRRAVADVKGRLEAERERLTSRLSTLDSQTSELSKELESTKAELEEEETKRRATSMLGRLFGRNAGPSKGSQEKLKDLTSRLEGLKGERATLVAEIGNLNNAFQGSPSQELADAQAKLADAEVERERQMQLSAERELLTVETAKMISELKLAGPESSA